MDSLFLFIQIYYKKILKIKILSFPRNINLNKELKIEIHNAICSFLDAL